MVEAAEQGLQARRDRVLTPEARCLWPRSLRGRVAKRPYRRSVLGPEG
jgi:hypothetical protein